MPKTFDVNFPFWVHPDYAEEQIQTGWIGQSLSDGWISRWVRYGTQASHSHSMMFLRNGGDRLDLLEVREFIGGRRRSFRYHTGQSGRIDVFSTDTVRWPEFDAAGAGYAMRDMVDYEYGWWGIFHMLLRRTPFLWYLYRPDTNDALPHELTPTRQPFCSHAVSLATHRGGGVDPVPRLPHWLVSPGMLTQSLFYNYEFSIASPWCVDYYGDIILARADANQQMLQPE